MLIAEAPIRGGAPGSNPGPHGAEARTRNRVRQAISEQGPLTAAALASQLELTPAAVRRHLNLLDEQGAIEECTLDDGSERGRGRPARAYILSDSGHADLDSGYEEVATLALRFLAEHSGVDAVEEFARERSAELEARYAALLDTAGEDVTARAQALAVALSADGFAASTQPVVAGMPLAGVQLRQGHCPVQHVAAEFPAFCDAETDAFSRLLGVKVQRLATLAHGEHVCTTFVPISADPTPAPSTTSIAEGSPP